MPLWRIYLITMEINKVTFSFTFTSQWILWTWVWSFATYCRKTNFQSMVAYIFMYFMGYSNFFSFLILDKLPKVLDNLCYLLSQKYYNILTEKYHKYDKSNKQKKKDQIFISIFNFEKIMFKSCYFFHKSEKLPSVL